MEGQLYTTGAKIWAGLEALVPLLGWSQIAVGGFQIYGPSGLVGGQP